MNKILLSIDGNSLMHRAFWALPQMNDSNGRPTNALYGFLNMFISLVEKYNPNYLFVAFDKKGKTFRHDFYTEYKAGRLATPPELIEQFDYIKDILFKLNIKYIELDSYEADDIIGTMALYSNNKNYLVTGDKDYLQLINENTSVLLTRKGISEIEEFDLKHLNEIYGLKPNQIVDLKSLMGDSSDNIPGIQGIGEKTALKLLHEYESLDNIYNNFGILPENKLKEKLNNGKDDAYLSYRLAKINTAAPVGISLEDIQFNGFDNNLLYSVFVEYSFGSLIKKYCNQENYIKKSLSQLVNIDEAKNIIRNSSDISLFFDDNFHFSVNAEYDYFIEIKHNLISNGYDFGTITDFIKSEMSNKKIIGFDIKSLMHLLNIQFSIYEDIHIASWLINPTSFPGNFEAMCSLSNLEPNAASVFVLNDKYNQQISDSDLDFIYRKIELPLIKVLYSMEKEGVYVNKNKLENLKDKYSEKISLLAEEIYEYAGHDFNISSPKQLGKILFEELGLPVIKKNKSGYSTDAAVLDKLENLHPIISVIKEYRQMTKLLSTYVEGLLNVVINNKVHTTFLQTATATGRLSSVEPNLQNIPVRSEISEDIRSTFFAPEDYFILSADYSQIELRILAHIASDDNLKDAFMIGQDIHARTASQILHKPIDAVTAKERKDAKAVNFGIVYGISDFGLSQNVGISVKKASAYITEYLNEFSGINKYMEEIKSSAHKNGYVKTLYGRIRYIPELSNSNYNIRSFGERAAMNTPIQGTAADIIKIAMINVYRNLIDGNYKSKLILQVHDELILYVHKDETDELTALIKDIMINAADLSVPLDVNISTGKYWSEAK